MILLFFFSIIISGSSIISASLVTTISGSSTISSSTFVEGSSSPYVNVLCVKEGNENLPAVQAVIKALKSDKVKNYISEKYPNGEVVAVF